MDKKIYDTYYRMEREHWWFLARKEIIFMFLGQRSLLLPGKRILDIGAGTGSYLEEFQKRGLEAEGHDASEEVIAYLKQFSRFKIAQKTFPEHYGPEMFAQYDAVLLLDVLEHLPDDRQGLGTALKLLRPGGTLICTVPACKAMWSSYDVVSHHFRRYRFKQLKDLVDPASAKVIKLSHFSTFLFPFLFVVRVMENLSSKLSSKVFFNPHLVPRWLNDPLLAIFRKEIPILKKTNLPCGSSLLMILEKT